MLLQQKQVSGLLASLQQLQANIDGKPNMAAVNTAIDTAIAALVDGAPTALDTLKELAEKLQGEETALNALITTVDGKVAKTDVTNHIDATNGGFLADGSVASYSNILWLRSLHSNLAGIIDDLTAQVAGHATRLDAVEQMTSDLDDAKVSKYSITDLPGVASDDEERVAGFASVEAIARNVDRKIAKISNQPATIDFTSYNHPDNPNHDYAFTLPEVFNQVLEVKINGQVFAVNSAEAFNIDGSTAGDGHYNQGDTLVLNGALLGFVLESTDKIYITLTTTLSGD